MNRCILIGNATVKNNFFTFKHDYEKTKRKTYIVSYKVNATKEIFNLQKL